MAHDVSVFEFQIKGIDDELRVVRFHGTEGLSQLYRYEIDLACTEASLDFEEIIGAMAELTLRGEDDEHRVIGGIISRFEQTGRGKALAYYHAQLVPKVWPLTLRRDSRIFQEKTSVEIMTAVLEGAGLANGEDFKMSLQGTYGSRSYCVQYRESDYDFIQRLMEEEGIFTYFENEDNKHVFVLCDHADSLTAMPGEATLPFRESGGGLTGGEEVGRFTRGNEIRPGAVVLRDYNFKTPSLSLEVKAKGKLDTDLEQYDFPGEYPSPSIGKDLANVRLQEYEAERDYAEGESNCRRLASGYRFTLADHPRDAFNIEYLVVRVRQFGQSPGEGGADTGGTSGPAFRARFECVPAETPWRPARVTPAPRIDGVQTATVTGEKGEEIHTDEHGRVKVQFHWDRLGGRDDKSSCWIRVSQAWGGGGYGAMIIPRVGHEVIVEFLEGDPDRPIITGRVYNGVNPAPHGLPGAKNVTVLRTNTTPGGGGYNEIKMDDSAGSQMFHLHAQKDMNVKVVNNKTEHVGVDETLTTGSNLTHTIGANDMLSIGQHSKLEVKGNETIEIAGTDLLVVGGSEGIGIGGDFTLDVGGALAEVVGGVKATSVKGKASQTVAGASLQQIGGAKIVNVKGNHTLTVGGIHILTVGGGCIIKVTGAMSEACASYSMTAAGAASVKADGAMVLNSGGPLLMEAGGKLTLKAGGAKIEMDGGNVKIEGSGITLKASGALTLKGSSVKEN